MIRRVALVAALLASTPAWAVTQYLDSSVAGASDSNNCTASNTPCATLSGVLVTAGSHTALAAGDVLMVGSHHAESPNAAKTYALPGTPTNPNFIFGADDTNWAAGAHTVVSADLVDPTSAASPLISNNNTFTFSGSFWMQGVGFTTSSAGAAPYTFNSVGANTEIYNKSRFALTANSTSPQFTVGNTAGTTAQDAYFYNSQFSFANAGQSIILGSNATFQGGAMASGAVGMVLGTAPTSLFKATGSTGPIGRINGVDISAVTGNLVASDTHTSVFYFTNCKLGSGVKLISATPSNPNSTDVHVDNCSAAATYYELHWLSYRGNVDTDTTNFLNSGTKYDGTHGISYKLTSSGNNTLARPMVGPWSPKRHLDSGVAKTLSMQILFDGANSAQGFNSTTINNNQVWMECGWSSSATTPLDSIADDAIADFLPSTSAAAQSASASTWTSPSLTTPEPVSLSVTVTPALAGYYACRLKAVMGTSGRIIWADPGLTVQ